jgi:hypothetical protein
LKLYHWQCIGNQINGAMIFAGASEKKAFWAVFGQSSLPSLPIQISDSKITASESEA